MSEPTTTYDPDENSERSYAIWLRCAREIKIRAGTLPPSTPEEQRWASEGERKPSELDSVRG